MTAPLSQERLEEIRVRVEWVSSQPVAVNPDHQWHFAALRELLEEVERQREIVKAAKAFVGTTSVYRLRRESRPEFETLALLLLKEGS